jgi:chitinase
MRLRIRLFIACLTFSWSVSTALLAKDAGFRIVGYYAGNKIPIDSFETDKLTHLIFCFGHLEGNRFSLRNASDTSMIRTMVALKKYHPALKVLLSLGGWSGCRTCSEVFADADARMEFANSVREVTDYFGTDGIDIDWEYPVVKGFPGHPRSPEDRPNFTALLRSLREANRPDFELSFAAGGYSDYIDSAIEWKEVVPLVDFINVMTYDLVHGYSTVSGHHTPLYSTNLQTESTDHAVQLLMSEGVPSEKIVIGCGFYGRIFRIQDGYPAGLYQPASFLNTFRFSDAKETLFKENGFEVFWDKQAQAPFAIDSTRHLVATYDDEQSVSLKTEYAVSKKLGGVMFWQLCDDKLRGGLLNTIWRNAEGN